MEPRPAERLSLRARLIVGLVIVSALGFRLEVAASFHAPGGSGWLYQRLATELRHDHRFAYDAAPAPLTYGMLPGYPIFLAWVARTVPAPSEELHCLRAARANALLDVLSACLVGLALLRVGRGVALLGFLLVIVCPILMFLSSFALPESLATFLYTLALLLAARAGPDNVVRSGALAGLVIGCSQLLRSDALALVPPVALALLTVGGSGRRRATALLACAAVAAVVFSPWPARNYLRFGGFHPLRSEWITQRGVERPNGMMDWMRSWASGGVDQLYIPFVVERDKGFDLVRRNMLLPEMHDDVAEGERVTALMRLYNAQRLAPEVDEGFRALARERTARRPLRTFVTLPARRLWRMWQAIPEVELPVRSSVLGLPRRRAAWATLQLGLLAGALVGALVLGGGGARARRMLGIATLAVATRSLLFAYVLPLPTQRYVAPLFPLLMGLAAVGFWWCGRAAWSLRRAAQSG